uniref:Protein kinase domain-containing protein n=1 Tax=Aegilops tauschii subsp. strangulata TaxID=200361 RepID=A0A453SFP6_AEGTS
SASVANLTFLRRLHLPGNRLHGAVPSALGHLRYLKRLNLSDNSLDGAIPPSLSRCRQLDSISLGYNRLKGKIPWKLAALPNLGLLELRRNELQGEIPHELGSLHNLVVLDLGHNKLQGTIPSEISSLVNLEFVDISNNRLTGEIPPGIEYGLGNEVSIHGDVYSYGILLLEMFTGKRPTDSRFGESFGLHKYVQIALPERAAEVIDRDLLAETEDGKESSSNSNSNMDLRIACITSVLCTGISCSQERPTDRIQIGGALKELLAIRDRFDKELCVEGEPAN